jgi:PIN domain nuclease of toxin-antitoxin system
VKLLLDTHVVLWWRLDSRRLSKTVREAIATAPVVHVSAVSAWEVAIKSALGRLDIRDDFEHQVDAAGFEPLPITFAHAREAGRLPAHHADPFDRMLVAQARVERLTLVTHDDRIAKYDVATLLV